MPGHANRYICGYTPLAQQLCLTRFTESGTLCDGVCASHLPTAPRTLADHATLGELTMTIYLGDGSPPSSTVVSGWLSSKSSQENAEQLRRSSNDWRRLVFVSGAYKSMLAVFLLTVT
ncbi:hypothetical protein GGX14DRAFT_563050 [Mycena pura]|uniref:Uncharacterized protein n=1 Tax=Mycena pura TaxID=153505 RepID=A0AAD6V3J1_9AGAR|nr:hypothetical protein GGX14DRAFT_574847 [Mycena pura]KAJ7215022.1 hypothetical protein GGX14DRAFT_563050 [Mycena pura]